MRGVFLYSGIQTAISFSYIRYIFSVWSLSEMKQLASIVFQLTINFQGIFVSLVPYLPRKGKYESTVLQGLGVEGLNNVKSYLDSLLGKTIP